MGGRTLRHQLLSIKLFRETGITYLQCLAPKFFDITLFHIGRRSAEGNLSVRLFCDIIAKQSNELSLCKVLIERILP